MTILEEFTPSLEVYFIDEGFLNLTGVCSQDPVTYGQRIRQAINRETGIPVCVGMGPTKTLAKLANFAAKKWKKTGGVLDLSDPVRREKLMKIVSVRYLVVVSRQLLEVIFKPGYAYQKAGVQLDNFQSMQAARQRDLFSLSKPEEERLNNVELMAAMDLINRRFPKAVTVAAMGLAKSPGPVSDYVSPRYTTCWEELPKVKC